MYNDDELMDIDGPEFISEVNSQIAAIRSASASQQASGSAASGNEDLSAYYDYYRRGMQGSPVAQEYATTPFMQVAVIDTNFLISNLGYLKTLTGQAAKYHGSLVLVIPWIVVKELDGLKGMNHQKITHGDVGSLARKAMKFIEDALREKCAWLRGQKSYEIYDERAKLTKGDDSILDCCLFFHHRMGKQVTLLTNDRNLAIQAMIHDVRSLSAENKVHLADFTQSLSKGQVTAPYETMESLGMDVDATPAYVGGGSTSEYVISGGPVYDEDIDMDMDEPTPTPPAPAPARAASNASVQKDSIYASRYAPGNRGPANFYENGQRSNKSYRDNDPLDSVPPPRDKYGEELRPPSSSQGRLEERTRNKQQQHQQQHAGPSSSSPRRDGTSWSSAYAPR